MSNTVTTLPNITRLEVAAKGAHVTPSYFREQVRPRRVAALTKGFQEIAELHQPRECSYEGCDWSSHCVECSRQWPCPTRRIVDQVDAEVGQ